MASEREEWLISPFSVIERLFHTEKYSLGNFHQVVTESFTTIFDSDRSLLQIPSLNDTPVHNLKPNSVVRFRCMIQDMFDPEFYLDAYEVVNKLNQERKMMFGFGKDRLTCKSVEEVDMESTTNVTSDRLTYYCISVPAETKWVQEGYASISQNKVIEPDTINERPKRSHEESCEMQQTDEPFDNSKKLKTSVDNNDEAPKSMFSLSNLNFPLPETNGSACLVKLYGSAELKVNDVIEVFGILSIDAPLCNSYASEDNADEMLNFVETDLKESNACNPPSSLVPRLHALFIRPLVHNNPLLPVHKDTRQFFYANSSVMHDAKDIYKELHAVLTQSLFGDTLAADYIICYLISSVYARKDVMVLGKFCLNLYNIPPSTEYIQKLTSLIHSITTKAYTFPMSLENLNSLAFLPKKDYSANQLISGLLQLSDHTHLILNETALSVGQLNSQGIRNIRALSDLIEMQKVEYDFEFHHLEYVTNVPVLILSEGKSMLPCDFRVCLKHSSTAAESVKNSLLSDDDLEECLLNKIRCYLTVLKLSDYSIPDDLQTIIQNDFVRMRKENNAISGDYLHNLLILSRYLSLSMGESELSKETWGKAKCMELERRRRIHT